jgi:hypothetical protein
MHGFKWITCHKISTRHYIQFSAKAKIPGTFMINLNNSFCATFMGVIVDGA